MEAVLSHSEYFTQLKKLIVLPILKENPKPRKMMAIPIIIIVDTLMALKGFDI